ncbi:MAG: hypothetical protein WC955_10080 [Elusimicrobiota bacterium]
MKKLFVVIGVILALLIPLNGYAVQPITPLEMIDAPTAEVVDHESVLVNFRVYENGGLLTKIVFGVINRLQLGLTMDIAKVIGRDQPELHQPQLDIKFRFFDGNVYVPALALGYNSQGYLYNELLKQYAHREKGLYLVASREIVDGLELHLGTNVYDFEKDIFYGFLGMSWLLGERFMTCFELDNIRNSDEVRVNFNLAAKFTDNLTMELAVRDMVVAANHSPDRVLKITYQTWLKNMVKSGTAKSDGK